MTEYTTTPGEQLQTGLFRLALVVFLAEMFGTYLTVSGAEPLHIPLFVVAYMTAVATALYQTVIGLYRVGRGIYVDLRHETEGLP